jgi:integrase
VTWHKTQRWYFMHSGADGKRRAFYASREYPRTDAGRRKADAWMEGVLKEQADRVVTGGEFGLDDLRLAFLTWCKKQVAKDELSQHTLDGHRKHLNLVCAMMRPQTKKTYGDLIASELKTRDLAELVDAWEAPPKGKRKMGPTTIRNRIGSLQAMLNWAAKSRDDRPVAKLIEVNPVARYELPKATYQGERYAAADEVDAFLGWLDQRAAEATGALARFERMIATLVRMAAETGCRPGELCAITWDHYDAKERAFVLPPKLHKTGRKTGRPRFIVLTKGLVELIEGLRADPERHPSYVFTHECGHHKGRTEVERRQGDPWNSNALSRRIRELRRDAIKERVLTEDKGLKRMHLYRLRHTRITKALAGGAKLDDVATLSGNSPSIIVETYLHPQIGHLRDVVDRLDEK